MHNVIYCNPKVLTKTIIVFLVVSKMSFSGFFNDLYVAMNSSLLLPLSGKIGLAFMFGIRRTKTKMMLMIPEMKQLHVFTESYWARAVSFFFSFWRAVNSSIQTPLYKYSDALMISSHPTMQIIF